MEFSVGNLHTIATLRFRKAHFLLTSADPENQAYIDSNLPMLIDKLRPEAEAKFRQEVENQEKATKAEKKAILEGELEEALKEAEEQKRDLVAHLDPDELAKKALDNSPIRWLSQVSRDNSCGWNSDVRTDRKAYIFACFSELAYLQHSKFDLPGQGRYKVVPSEALEYLRTRDVHFNLEEVVRSVVRGEGLAVAVTDPGRGFVYVTIATPNFVVIAVRGTSTLSELLFLDLNTLKVGNGDEHYHRGFYNEANTAMGELKKQRALKAAEGKDIPIYFTGHSLGAAISWVFRNIWGTSHKVMTPYIYASPRIGNDAAARKSTVYAYTRQNDPVPHLPPLALDFRNPTDAITVNPDEEKKWQIQLWAKFWTIGKNHSIERYRVELGEKTKDPQFSPDEYYSALFAEMIDVHRVLKLPLPYGAAPPNSNEP